jgi:hypothetical protein
MFNIFIIICQSFKKKIRISQKKIKMKSEYVLNIKKDFYI